MYMHVHVYTHTRTYHYGTLDSKHHRKFRSSPGNIAHTGGQLEPHGAAPAGREVQEDAQKARTDGDEVEVFLLLGHV